MTSAAGALTGGIPRPAQAARPVCFPRRSQAPQAVRLTGKGVLRTWRLSARHRCAFLQTASLLASVFHCKVIAWLRYTDLQVMSTSHASTTSAVAERSAEAQLRTLIERFAPPHLRLVGAMRRSLRKRLPAAIEVVYEYREWFVISYSPSEHGYEGVLVIRGDANGVKLYFNRGKELPDPAKLLKGSGQTRFINVEGASTLTRPEVARLIDEAIARNPVPFAPAGRGSVIIRPTSAKKQRRQRRPA